MSVRDVRICIFGDSFAAGVGDPTYLGWVGRVAQRTQDNIQMTIYNLGVRGDSSAHVVARFDAELTRRLRTDVDMRVVASFGVNDTLLKDGVPRVSIDKSCAALEALITKANDHQLPLLIIGPTPVADSEHNIRIAALSSRFAEICQGRTIPFVEAYSTLVASGVWMDEVCRGDGAHPEGTGYQALADVAFPAWSAWLTAPAGSGSRPEPARDGRRTARIPRSDAPPVRSR